MWADFKRALGRNAGQPVAYSLGPVSFLLGLQAALQKTGARAAGSPWGLLQCARFPALWAAWLSDTEAVSIHLLLCLRPRGQGKPGLGPSAEPAGGGWDRTAAASAGPCPPPPARLHQAGRRVEGAATRLGILCLQSIGRPTWFSAQRPGCVPLRPACAWACGGSTPGHECTGTHAICQRLQNLGLNTSPR